jgi:hypothetical protein
MQAGADLRAIGGQLGWRPLGPRRAGRCYPVGYRASRDARFELISLSLLKHWTWPVVAVDVGWGAFVTAAASTLGLLIADVIGPRI